MFPELFFCITVVEDKVVTTQQFGNLVVIGSLDDVLKNSPDNFLDKLMILDIRATLENRIIDYDLIKSVSSTGVKAFFGGGVASYQDVEACLSSGAAGVVINSAAVPSELQVFADDFGSDSIIAAVDVKRYGNLLTSRVCSGTKPHSRRINAKELVKDLSSVNVGGILLTSISHDGMRIGYDLETLSDIAPISNSPVIINGGATCFDDMDVAVHYGADSSAVRSILLAGVNQ